MASLQAAADEAERNAMHSAGLQNYNQAPPPPLSNPDPALNDGTTTTTATVQDSTTAVASSPTLRSQQDMKEQKVINTTTCAAAMEECEALLSMQETGLSYIVNKIPHFKKKLEQSYEAVRTVEDQYRWTAPSGWSVERLIERHEMDVRVQELQSLLALGTPDAAAIRSVLQELSTTQVSKSRLIQRRETLKGANTFAPLGVSDVTIGLYEYLHTDVLSHAKSELSRTDVGRTRLLKQIETLTHQREDAHARGDVVALEEAHRSIIESYTELLEILVSRLDQLLLSGADTQNFRGQIATVIHDADESYNAFEKAKKELLDRVCADYTKSENVRKQANAEHTAAMNAYSETSITSMKGLRENAAAQETILETIRQQFLQLQKLGEERKVMVETHLAAKQVEEQRIAAHNEFIVVQADHLTQLAQLRDQTESCCTLSSALLQYLAKMSKALEQREVEDELSGLTLDEGKSYLKHYRGTVFAIGDLAEKKQHRIDALQRQARQLQLQRDTAVESLDPNGAIYAEQLDKVHSQLDAAQATLAHLQSLQEMHASNFHPTETMLRKEGVQFTHPLVEQGEISAEHRKQFMERTLRYVEEEERELDRSRESVARMRQLTLAEQEESLRRMTSQSPSRHPAATATSDGSPSP